MGLPAGLVGILGKGELQDGVTAPRLEKITGTEIGTTFVYRRQEGFELRIQGGKRLGSQGAKGEQKWGKAWKQHGDSGTA